MPAKPRRVQKCKQKSPSKEKAALSLPLILFAVFCFIFSGLTGATSTYVPLLLQELLGGTSLAGTVLFLGTLMRIADVFGVSTDYLLGRTKELSFDEFDLDGNDIAHLHKLAFALYPDFPGMRLLLRLYGQR